MSLTYEEAQDDILTVLKSAWDTTGKVMFYEGVRGRDKPTDAAWARAVLRHAGSGQRSLGGRGNRIFERTGILIVQINTLTGNGLSESYQLARVVTDAFEGQESPNGVRFGSPSIREAGSEGAFFSMNVNVPFEYDEIK